jgi:hypothetical protein
MTPREKEIVADARLKSPEFITKVVRNCVPKSGPSMAGASCVSAVERIFVAQETPPCVLLSAAYAVSAPPAVGRVGPELVSLSPSPGVTSASAGPAADRPDAELGPLCVEARTGGSDSPLRSSTPTARPKPMADRAADGPPGGMAAATSAEPQHAPIMVSPSAAGMGGGLLRLSRPHRCRLPSSSRLPRWYLRRHYHPRHRWRCLSRGMLGVIHPRRLQ